METRVSTFKINGRFVPVVRVTIEYTLESLVGGKFKPRRVLVQHRIPGPVERELIRYKDAPIRYKDAPIDRLFHWDSKLGRYGVLSELAQRVLTDAHEQLTGMRGINSYWLLESMSEAIEAAAALGL